MVQACVAVIARRLNRTKNWVVALKSLMLIQRLLSKGGSAFEHEIFFTMRRGTRFLNMCDFRDSSSRNAWDYGAFIRAYGLYLDELLELRMQGSAEKGRDCYGHYGGEEEEEGNGRGSGIASNAIV
ncbi:ENTH/ANTH/VHS superfamily protein, partial [Perilla frutescens var. frutescens]